MTYPDETIPYFSCEIISSIVVILDKLNIVIESNLEIIGKNNFQTFQKHQF